MNRPPFAAVLASWALALPFWVAYTESPISNFWPMVASWCCGAMLLALVGGGFLRSARLAGGGEGCWGERGGQVLANGLVWAALVAATIGLAQYFGLTGGMGPWAYPSEAGQSVGNLRQRNQQATLLALGAWAVLWTLLHQPARWGREAQRRGPREGRTPLSTVATLGAIAWLAIAMAATTSRTGVVHWVLLCGLLACWRRTGQVGTAARWAVLGLGILAAAAWVLPEVLWQWRGVQADALFERLTDDRPSCDSRRVLWSNVLALIAERPWLGWGWGELDYAHYVSLFPGGRFCVLLDNAHNLPLQLAVELGVPAAALLCATGVFWCARSAPAREVRPHRQLAWGVLALITVHSLLEYPLWYGPFQIVAGVAVALLLVPTSGALRQRWSPSRALAIFCMAMAALVVSTCAIAMGDYFRVAQLYKPVADRAPAYRENTQAKVERSWMFQSSVDFARLTTTPLVQSNAQALHVLATGLLHYSPEPRVIQVVIESAVMLGRDDVAAFHLKRYRAAYPEEYAQWRGTAKVP